MQSKPNRKVQPIHSQKKDDKSTYNKIKPSLTLQKKKLRVQVLVEKVLKLY